MHTCCVAAAAFAKHRNVTAVSLYTTLGIAARMLTGLDHIIIPTPTTPVVSTQAAAPTSSPADAAPAPAPAAVLSAEHSAYQDDGAKPAAAAAAAASQAGAKAPHARAAGRVPARASASSSLVPAPAPSLGPPSTRTRKRPALVLPQADNVEHNTNL
jgi:hypothetical protein